MGNPVRQVRPLTDDEIKGLKKSAENYTNWKQDYIDSQ